MEVDHQTSRAAPKIQKVFLTLEFDEICNICKSLEKSILEKRTGSVPPIPKPHPVLPLFLPAAFPLPCPLSQLPLQDWHRHTLDILTPSPWLLDLFYRLFVFMLSSFQSHFHFLCFHFFFLISCVVVRHTHTFFLTFILVWGPLALSFCFFMTPITFTFLTLTSTFITLAFTFLFRLPNWSFLDFQICYSIFLC